MISYDDACSREREAPSPAPGPVERAEIVVKFVLLETQLIHNAEGQPVLSAAAFPNDELQRGDLRVVPTAHRAARPGAGAQPLMTLF